MYKSITLSSGREVHICPLSWNSYWELAKRRMTDDEASASPLTADRLDDLRTSREFSLTECVRDFATLEPPLTVREVREMEQHINRLSEPEIAEGNL